MKTVSTEEALAGGGSGSQSSGSASGPGGNIAKPVARRFDLDEVLRGSAFSAVTAGASRVALRPMELRSTDSGERSRRSMSLGPVSRSDNDDDDDDGDMPSPPDPSDKVEFLLLFSVV